jgi:uncharacterized protein YjeT (DUF2065 family)
MNLRHPEDEGNEGEYLQNLTTRYVPQRIKDLIQDPSIAKLTQLLAIGVFTVTVGLGYLYGIATYR